MALEMYRQISLMENPSLRDETYPPSIIFCNSIVDLAENPAHNSLWWQFPQNSHGFYYGEINKVSTK